MRVSKLLTVASANGKGPSIAYWGSVTAQKPGVCKVSAGAG
jgi:hypothetical protein